MGAELVVTREDSERTVASIAKIERDAAQRFRALVENFCDEAIDFVAQGRKEAAHGYIESARSLTGLAFMHAGEAAKTGQAQQARAARNAADEAAALVEQAERALERD